MTNGFLFNLNDKYKQKPWVHVIDYKNIKIHITSLYKSKKALIKYKDEFTEYNWQLKLQANQLNLKLQGMTKQSAIDNEEVVKYSSFIESFQKLISGLVENHIENISELKRRLVEIFRTYIIEDSMSVQESVDKKTFYLESRNYLENFVNSLTEQRSKNFSINRNNNKHIIKGFYYLLSITVKGKYLYWYSVI